MPSAVINSFLCPVYMIVRGWRAERGLELNSAKTKLGHEADYLALLRKKLKLASCPARVIALAWQPMHVPPCEY